MLIFIIILLLFNSSHLEAKKRQKNNTLKYIILPVFPFPAWTVDKRTNKYELKNYRSFHTFMDLFIEKGQDGHAGYDLSASFYKKFFGTFIRYEITSNLEFKNRTFDFGFVYRFKPKKQIRPSFAVAYKYLNFDRIGSGSGLVFSFMHYEIMFTTKFGISVKSFIGAVNYQLYADGNLCLLYKVYPSVAFRFGGSVAKALGVNLYSLKLGVSLRL